MMAAAAGRPLDNAAPESVALPVGETLSRGSGSDSGGETALIRAARAGDRRAFEELVRPHDGAVLRLAVGLLRSPEDARDIYQEALLRAWRHLDRFRFDCSFYTWLYRIVTNVCLDHLRKRRARPEEPILAEGSEGRTGPASRLAEGRAHGDPERSLRARQIGERIGSALGDLSPRERLVFEMRHYEGMRLGSIGEILGTSEEAARNCLFRATRKMRSALGDLT